MILRLVLASCALAVEDTRGVFHYASRTATRDAVALPLDLAAVARGASVGLSTAAAAGSSVRAALRAGRAGR